VDELLRSLSAVEWAFIAAHNPVSKVLDAAENEKRHEELQADIQTLGLTYYQGKGIGPDPARKPETSLLILGLSHDDAVAIGRRYEQNAIVLGQLPVPQIESPWDSKTRLFSVNDL
jgi:hypothetical protein